ncbi:MAG: hypothetical protein CO135_00315 [Candidatus Levybacteria bacterium CG_4_9_14_3_um_filter_35_16]|nr:MAG: hypothetical protein COY68_03005 [Candidatus Levybacteria bacterium CG_4_10_14_0_8_um_filter_35_23]PJA91610.1 MAG: hypothetical protein CO135_00315 [Candidatus Levybacteria bacterium CG_4_9_14_3_um_filter_35_16]PJC54112.1 MAG: hypothetical protein CO028_04155 [Candidatus Levybacteria bacterium CG_4_9_14_0_2_um_filter_35_21]
MLYFLNSLIAKVLVDPPGNDYMGWDKCLAEGTDVATLQCIPIVLKNVVNAALIFSGSIALILVILSGIKFITSKGDQKQVDTAKRTLTYAILGLIIILLSFFIIQFVSFVTGVQCINAFGFDNCK